MTSKRELVLKAFRGEPVDRVPVGFWHHFTSEEELLGGFGNQAIIEKNLAGHQAFLAEVEPDFIKLMSDGYFAYPNERLKKVQSIKELVDIEPLGADHPWISEQVELVQKIKASFTEDLVAIYNIFAPVTYFKWLVGKVAGGDDIIADFLAEDAALTKRVLDVIAQDIAVLTERIIKEAGADGIYLSVQSIQDARVSAEDYKTFIAPSELSVLEAANAAGGVNILHICGYEGARNDVHLFTDYPAQVINWAVGPEGISLAEGRKLFGGRTVLGGFENGKDGLLYTGSQVAIKDETKRLIAEAGKEALIIGADCTIPSDIKAERIQWVRQAARLA
ncbi:uroporphyrinogen decarboxylase [Streptococcus sanguinis]|uniref:Uroporphyrinogen decarboxylase n=1 Tax=Streptococcus sanguinis TaxID=1305 RepID=A0AAJ5T9J7_STRSA|nr:uroporphyrinogen decarboxylase family protein [Streptococcus sanguinis]MCY7028140.1 uroporphyrinogen decarboxylase [Streptococcus sanguinis]VDY69883.1 uroporphyrinogen decarboxylase [Streptococcus sanguinis]